MNLGVMKWPRSRRLRGTSAFEPQVDRPRQNLYCALPTSTPGMARSTVRDSTVNGVDCYARDAGRRRRVPGARDSVLAIGGGRNGVPVAVRPTPTVRGRRGNLRRAAAHARRGQRSRGTPSRRWRSCRRVAMAPSHDSRRSRTNLPGKRRRTCALAMALAPSPVARPLPRTRLAATGSSLPPWNAGWCKVGNGLPPRLNPPGSVSRRTRESAATAFAC